MGASSSKPALRLPALIASLEPTGVLANYTSQSKEVKLYFSKLTGLDHKYEVNEAGSGKPIFFVESDLVVDGDSKGSTTRIWDAIGSNQKDPVLLITSAATTKWQWAIRAEEEGEGEVRPPCCLVERQSSGRKSKLSVEFIDAAGKERARERKWVLRGDKSRQSAVISNADEQPIAHVERQSRNRAKRFCNPHAYVLTVAPGADVALLVGVCVCLDQYENQGMTLAEGHRHRSTHVGGSSGAIDANGFGSACF